MSACPSYVPGVPYQPDPSPAYYWTGRTRTKVFSGTIRVQAGRQNYTVSGTVPGGSSYTKQEWYEVGGTASVGLPLPLAGAPAWQYVDEYGNPVINLGNIQLSIISYSGNPITDFQIPSHIDGNGYPVEANYSVVSLAVTGVAESGGTPPSQVKYFQVNPVPDPNNSPNPVTDDQKRAMGWYPENYMHDFKGTYLCTVEVAEYLVFNGVSANPFSQYQSDGINSGGPPPGGALDGVVGNATGAAGRDGVLMEMTWPGAAYQISCMVGQDSENEALLYSIVDGHIPEFHSGPEHEGPVIPLMQVGDEVNTYAAPFTTWPGTPGVAYASSDGRVGAGNNFTNAYLNLTDANGAYASCSVLAGLPVPFQTTVPLYGATNEFDKSFVHIWASLNPDKVCQTQGRVRRLNTPYPATSLAPVRIYSTTQKAKDGVGLVSSPDGNFNFTNSLQRRWSKIQAYWYDTPYETGGTQNVHNNTIAVNEWLTPGTPLPPQYPPGGGVNAPPAFANSNGGLPAQVFLVPGWMAGAGENPGDYRVLLSGKSWLAMTVQQAATLNIYDGSTFDGWSTFEGTLVFQDPGILFDTNDPANCCSYDTTGQSWDGYRYLRVTIASLIDNYQPFTIRMQTPAQPLYDSYGIRVRNLNEYPPLDRKWSGVTGITGFSVTVDFDLCSPDNSTNEPDWFTAYEDTSWPYAPDELDHEAVTDRTGSGVKTTEHFFSELWGVSNPLSLNLEGTAPGESYLITSIELVRKKDALVSVLPSENNQCQYFKNHYGLDVFNNVYADLYPYSLYALYQRGIVFDTDGRQSGEAPWDIDFTGGNHALGYPYVFFPIHEVANHINRNLCGWTATEATTFPDAFHTNAQGGAYLCGGGSVWVDGEWQDSLWMDGSKPLPLYAQALWDTMDWYPGCGDPYINAGYGDLDYPFPIRFNKMLGAAGSGLAFHTDGTPADGAKIDVEKAVEGTLLTEAVVDTTGYWRTAPIAASVPIVLPNYFLNFGYSNPTLLKVVSTDLAVVNDVITPGIVAPAPSYLTVNELSVQIYPVPTIPANGWPWYPRRITWRGFRQPYGSSGADRVLVIRRELTGHGRRFVSDGKNISQVDYYDVKPLALMSAGEHLSGPVAQGNCETGFRDHTGKWTLIYSRNGSMYHIQDKGKGWSAEKMILTGYTRAKVSWNKKHDRGVMAAIQGATCYAFSVYKDDTGNYVYDTANRAVVCPADGVSVEIERMHDASLQAWVSNAGSLTTWVSLDDGKTWRAA